MILNEEQIKNLLSQGAITEAQARSLAASNHGAFVDHSAMNTPFPKEDAGSDIGGDQSPPAAPAQVAQAAAASADTVAQQVTQADKDRTQEVLSNAEANPNGQINSPATVNSLGQPLGTRGPAGPATPIGNYPPMAPVGNPLNGPVTPPVTNEIKGENTLKGAAGVNAQGQVNAGPNDPAQLMLPKQAPAGPPNLNPEKKLLSAELGLSSEGVSSLSNQKEQLDKLNQMQEVATNTAGDIAIQNSAAMMKEQNENKASWQTAMAKADEQSAEIQRRAQEIATRKVDPNRYWNSMDSAGQFYAGLSLFLGTFGSSLTKTPNYAMERMQNAIKNDIESQKADIETAYKGLGIEQDQAHTDLQRAQIDNAYKDKLTLQHWEIAKSQAQGMIAKMQAPIDKQKGDILLNGIDDQIRQSKLGMATNIYNFETLQRKANAIGPTGPNETEVRKYVTDRKNEFMEKGDNEQDANDRAVKLASERFGLGMKGGQATLPTLEDDKTKVANAERAKMIVNLPTGEKAEARSESAANEFNKRQMAIGQLGSITKRMQAIRDRNKGGTVINRADVAEAQSLQEQAINQYNEITGFNRAPGQPERVGLKGEVIPDVTDYSWGTGKIERKLESLKQFVQNAYDLNNNTYLKNPPKKGYNAVEGKDNSLADAIGATRTGS